MILLILYVHEYKNIDIYDINQFTKSDKYQLGNISIDDEGTLTAILNVDEFEYAPVMWSNDKIELDASIMDRVATTGYDINIQIGVLDEKTGTIYGHKTSLISDYPVMIHYPDNSVKVRAARFDKDDINTNALVMLVTTHEGYLYYQYL